MVVSRSPHPATVLQTKRAFGRSDPLPPHAAAPREEPTAVAAGARAPHPASAQPKLGSSAVGLRPPHPATVVQPKAKFGSAIVRPPHPAKLAPAKSNSSRFPDASVSALGAAESRAASSGGPLQRAEKKKKPKKEKKKKSKVVARSKFEPDYLPSASSVDALFKAYSSASISETEIDKSHFLNFTVTVKGDDYEGHINIKGGYALAHVTIAYGGRKINYYYLVTEAGVISDPPGKYVSGGETEKAISDLPSDIKSPIMAMLRAIYA